MSRLLFFFAVLALLGSCARSGPGPPPVDLDQLAPVVTDVQLAEVLSNELPTVVRDSLAVVFYVNALADHGYDSVRFKEEMWEVRREPEWVDSLLLRVEEEIARRKVGQAVDPDRPAVIK